MISFLESTWFLWWGFTIVAIVRWFHAVSLGPEDGEDVTEFVFKPEPGRRVVSHPLGNN